MCFSRGATAHHVARGATNTPVPPVGATPEPGACTEQAESSETATSARIETSFI